MSFLDVTKSMSKFDEGGWIPSAHCQEQDVGAQVRSRFNSHHSALREHISTHTTQNGEVVQKEHSAFSKTSSATSASSGGAAGHAPHTWRICVRLHARTNKAGWTDQTLTV